MIAGFRPIAGEDARVLVLGTVPSAQSLRDGRYYAHPRNSFWPMMEVLFAGGARLDHAEREELVRRSHVAVWDVLAAADRLHGSMDASIVSATAVPNDIAGFLAEHADIHTIFFNGATAETLFRRHVATTLKAAPSLRFERLPSTSPANAGVSPAEKLAAWRAVACAASGV